MVTSADFLQVAHLLQKELKETGGSFISKPRMEITELVREVSGSDNSRMKNVAAEKLETALLYQGIRVYPSLTETTTGAVIRLFHVGTIVASLVDMLNNPGDETDKQLAEVIKKVKGEWDWACKQTLPQISVGE